MSVDYEEKFARLKEAFLRDEVMLVVYKSEGSTVALLCVPEGENNYIPLGTVVPDTDETVIVRRLGEEAFCIEPRVCDGSEEIPLQHPSNGND